MSRTLISRILTALLFIICNTALANDSENFVVCVFDAEKITFHLNESEKRVIGVGNGTEMEVWDFSEHSISFSFPRGYNSDFMREIFLNAYVVAMRINRITGEVILSGTEAPSDFGKSKTPDGKSVQFLKVKYFRFGLCAKIGRRF